MLPVPARGHPAWLAGPAVTGSVAAAAMAQAAIDVIPPWYRPVVAVGLALLWSALDLLTRSPWSVRWQAPAKPGSSAAADTPLSTAGDGASPR